MTNDRLSNQLRQLQWRKLTEAEMASVSAWLAAHPEARAEWEAESRLSEALGRLPDVPVATNFTARVLQATILEERAQERRAASHWRWWQFRWLPRLAFSALVVSAALLSYHYGQHLQRTEMVQGVELVSQVTSLPSPEILKDFDAIRALDRTPPADEELLRLLQ